MNQSSYLTARTVPQTERGKKTRRQLLDAAEVEFGRAGFEAASIGDITKRAGVAQGTFYLYFTDKTAIFSELVDELGARLRHHLGAAVQGKKSRFDIERAGMRAFFEFTREHTALYRIIRQAEFVDLAAFRRYYERMAASYVRALKASQQAGEVAKIDPEVLAYCLMGVSDFLGMRYVLWGDEAADLDRVTEHAMRLVSTGMAVPPRGASKR